MVRKHHEHSPERRAITRWTARLGAVTAEALSVHLDSTVASARARLQAAVRAGLLTTHRPLAGAPSLYTATGAGLRCCGERGLDPCRVSPSGARHLIVCAQVAAGLERCYPDHDVLGERELRREERLHGGALASARLGEGRGGMPLLHRPDLVLAHKDELPVAVEVELTVKAPQRLEQICRGWARSSCVAGTLYIAAPQVRAALERAIERALAGARILIIAPDSIPGLGPDWTSSQDPEHGIPESTDDGGFERTVPSSS
jgi:hypothetical protein